MVELLIRPLTAAIGAEVEGIDLRRTLDDDERQFVEDALLRHHVLAFRGADVDERQHIDIAHQFGEVHLPPVPTKHGGPPEVNVLDQTDARGDGADRWHSDNSYIAVPPMGSLLKAVQIPRVGGDTCFANMHAAYESLSEPMKRYLEGLTAVHDVYPILTLAVKGGNSDFDIEEMRRKLPPVEHPVVRTHPVTGRKLLYVNEGSTSSIVGVSRRESDAILGVLWDATRSPDIQCRVKWNPGDLVFFDNRCTQHYAVPDYSERRVMHRVTIRGERPFYRAAA